VERERKGGRNNSHSDITGHSGGEGAAIIAKPYLYLLGKITWNRKNQ
jgi:hypothetical protein